jgi:hypothetical protein
MIVVGIAVTVSSASAIETLHLKVSLAKVTSAIHPLRIPWLNLPL